MAAATVPSSIGVPVVAPASGLVLDVKPSLKALQLVLDTLRTTGITSITGKSGVQIPVTHMGRTLLLPAELIILLCAANASSNLATLEKCLKIQLQIFGAVVMDKLMSVNFMAINFTSGTTLRTLPIIPDSFEEDFARNMGSVGACVMDSTDGIEPKSTGRHWTVYRFKVCTSRGQVKVQVNFDEIIPGVVVPGFVLTEGHHVVTFACTPVEDIPEPLMEQVRASVIQSIEGFGARDLQAVPEVLEVPEKHTTTPEKRTTGLATLRRTMATCDGSAAYVPPACTLTASTEDAEDAEE
jgi:hypothetical protein